MKQHNRNKFESKLYLPIVHTINLLNNWKVEGRQDQKKHILPKTLTNTYYEKTDI